MSLKRFLIATCAMLAIAPSTALAQSDQAGDTYLRPILLNEGTFADPRPVPNGAVPGFTVDTSTYGLQDDLFAPPASGGPFELRECGNTPFGKTAWSVFYAHRYGRMDVKAAGSFDQVIAIIPFESPDRDPTPIFDGGVCVDRIAGINEDFGNNPPAVSPGWYAIQMGGAGDTGGILQGTLEFLAPERLRGDAVWSWQGNPRGARGVVKATAPKGARISFKCARKRCGKLPRAQTIKKTVGDTLNRPLGDVTPRKAPSKVLREVSKDDPAIRAARSYLKGKQIPNGARLEVRITAPGFIGNYFSWSVKGGKAGTKVRRCMNPGSTRPQRRCSG